MGKNIGELLRAADLAVRSGRASAAQHAWQQVLRLDPEHPAALNGLGMLAMQQGRAEDAAQFFLRAATREPAATVLWLNHAKAARLMSDDAGEKASLLRAAEIEPTSLLVNVRLAELAERTGDDLASSKRWRTVVAIAGAMPDIPAEARAAVHHGRAVIAAQTAALSQRVDEAMAERRAQASFQHRRRIDAAIDHMFGRRPIYFNQCSGLHIPFLPADEYFERRLFPWLVDLENATAIIRSELVAALDSGREGFEPYVALPPGTPDNVWTPLDRNQDWSTLHLWRHGKRDDAVCSRFPQTAAVVDALPLAHLPDRMPTVFFSVLAPHAHIPPHTGVTNARAIVHLPLIVPSGCRFRVGGETRAWVEGEAITFDDTIEHEAWNDSDEARVVLILDTWNPHLAPEERELLLDFYSASDEGADTF